MPKRVKHRKIQRGRLRGTAARGNRVAFGDFGLQCLDIGWVAGEQLEAARVAAMHVMGTEGRIYVRAFPHMAVTAKPAETRMGTGKGEPEYYAARVRPGSILVEVGGVPEDMARDVCYRMARKFPVRVRLARRRAR